MTIQEKARIFAEYKQIKEEAEAIMTEMRGEIIGLLVESGNVALNTGQHIITLADRTRTTLDKKMLAASFGDLSRFEKVTQYQEFRVQSTGI